MQNLSICNTLIRLTDGMYSLNDLHTASGGRPNHKPANFVRLDQTKELCTEIERCSDVSIKAISTIRGRGKQQGTYGCKEIVYAYAMWISPAFMLQVIRAYDGLVTTLDKPTIGNTTSTDRVPLKNAVNLLVAKAKILDYPEAYSMVHQAMGVQHIDEIPADRLQEAVKYVHGLIGEYIPHNKAANTQTPTTPFSGLPNGRYLFVVRDNETTIKDIAGCNVVETVAMSNLRRDLRIMQKGMNELLLRMGIITGDMGISRLDDPLNMMI